MHELYWKEQEPHRNPALVGSLPWLELFPGWNFAPTGTLHRLELCPTETMPKMELCTTGTLLWLDLCPRLELCPDWNLAPGLNSASLRIQISKYLLAQYIRQCMNFIRRNSSLTITLPSLELYRSRGTSLVLRVGILYRVFSIWPWMLLEMDLGSLTYIVIYIPVPGCIPTALLSEQWPAIRV